MYAFVYPLVGLAVDDLHDRLAWPVVGALVGVGALGLILAFVTDRPGWVYRVLIGVVAIGFTVQIGTGYYAQLALDKQPESGHVFFGLTGVFVLLASCIYRGRLSRRPAVNYGLVALLMAGVAAGAIAAVGFSF